MFTGSPRCLNVCAAAAQLLLCMHETLLCRDLLTTWHQVEHWTNCTQLCVPAAYALIMLSTWWQPLKAWCQQLSKSLPIAIVLQYCKSMEPVLLLHGQNNPELVYYCKANMISSARPVAWRRYRCLAVWWVMCAAFGLVCWFLGYRSPWSICLLVWSRLLYGTVVTNVFCAMDCVISHFVTLLPDEDFP